MHKPKKALRAIYQAQKICSDLDETVERNLDYILAINVLSAHLLITMEQPNDALEFI
jgi:hypothetical protein